MSKTDFPFFASHPDVIYLDSAATTQKPQVVIDRILHYYKEECAPVGRSLYTLGIAATTAVEEVRSQVMHFVDAPDDSVAVFTAGATDALNLLTHGLAAQFEPGDEIILSEAEHHANLVPWQQVALERGARLLFVGTQENGCLNLEQLGETLSSKTKVVALSLVSNVFGTLLPVGEINELLNRQGSRPIFVLDAAQAASHFPLSVRTLGCDALVLAGHKMYGPSGVGVLWGRASLLESLTPYRTGGAMVNRVTLPETTFAPLPMRLEAGSPNTEGILGLGAAISYLEKIGFDHIKKHTEQVHTAILKGITAIPGISLLGEPDPGSGIVSVVHTSIHPHDLAQFMADRQICVRAGHQCAQPLHSLRNVAGSLRASIGLYNTREDAEAFTNALQEAVTFFS
jgi:cysteine desulfurase/selenocysteine lyase